MAIQTASKVIQAPKAEGFFCLLTLVSIAVSPFSIIEELIKKIFSVFACMHALQHFRQYKIYKYFIIIVLSL